MPAPFRDRPDARRRRWLLALSAMACVGAKAHDFNLGALVIDHPYATPTPPGASTGAVYFRTLKNTGKQPDRLVSATTPAAASVEMHRSTIDSANVMRMRAVDALELPAGASLKVRHGGDFHLMLVGLKAPLASGDRFPIRLRFEKAGEREVMVWVQQPREGRAESAHEHKH